MSDSRFRLNFHLARGCWLALSVPLVFACSSKDDAVAADDEGPGEATPDDALEPDEQAADPGATDSGTESDAGNEPEPMPSRAARWIGDGTAAGVELVELFAAGDSFFCTSAGCRQGIAVDLDFNPQREGELWVLYRQPYDGQVCNADDQGSLGCQLMASRMVVLSEATGPSPQAEVKDDGNAWHFLRLGTAIAFADDDSWASVGEARTGNFMDDPSDFMGATWWSSDPEIFGVDFGLNGSHLDMLHATPFGMGIAHDPSEWAVEGGYSTQPVFWAFNGDQGAIDRYDFKLPHVPGGEDHSDGTLHRYAPGQLRMVPGVPSHMEFAELGYGAPTQTLFGRVRGYDTAERTGAKRLMLYIADTGNQRIVRLDTSLGALGDPVATPDPQLADPRMVELDQPLEVVVPKGTLTLPSGLAVSGDTFFVTDAQTSVIHVFDLEGEELGRLATGLAPGALAGITVGPDERLYLVDWNDGRVLRVEPLPTEP